MSDSDRITDPIVVKVGGSLYDLSDLGPRLRCWLPGLSSPNVVLFPGGGAAANVVRDLDRRHRLGDEASHWLALRALTANAHFLRELLSPLQSVVSADLGSWPGLWRERRIPIVDAHAFFLADENAAGCLPHRWETTSDSLAGRVAVVVRAQRLMLLKSVAMEPGLAWSDAAHLGLVDSCFAATVASHAALEVRMINFREWQPVAPSYSGP
jgi:aspartokinase-like uncharacterized kinase